MAVEIHPNAYRDLYSHCGTVNHDENQIESFEQLTVSLIAMGWGRGGC